METIAFARGVPAPEMLPVPELQEAAPRAFAADPVTLLSYGTGGGYGPLRSHLAEQHGVEPSQVLVTSGSLQGFVLLAEHLAAEARAAGREPVCVVENPTYDRPLILLKRAGWRVEHVRMDGDGIDPDELAAVLERETVSMIYLIPSFQNPAGNMLSEERRGRVLELAERHGVPVLEDDPYGLLHFETPAPATLYSRGSGAEVVYSSSFSKTVSPGLRVGYLVLSKERAGAMERIANDTYISPSLLAEGATLEFLRTPAFEENLVSLRRQLSERCDTICTAIDENFPEATYVRPQGGYFIWVELPGVSTAELLGASSGKGVSFVPGDAFGPGNESAVRLAFSSPPKAEIAEGIRRLAGALETLTTRA